MDSGGDEEVSLTLEQRLANSEQRTTRLRMEVELARAESAYLRERLAVEEAKVHYLLKKVADG